MKKTVAAVIAIIAAIIFTGILTSCGGKPESIIIVAGSTSVQPYAEILAEEYERLYSENEIEVQGGGSSAGVTAAEARTADIGMSSRALKDSELESFKDTGQEWRIIEIAKDGLAIIVHPDNPVKDLSLEQVRAIYSAEIKNWKDVGGSDANIYVITREEGSGTRSAFEELVMGKSKVTPKAIVQDSNGAVRLLVSDYINYIGFISLGLVEPEPGQKPVRALYLDGAEATVENVVNGSYKLFRPFLFVTVVDEGKEPEGLTKSFIDFTLSPEGQEILRSEGLIPNIAHEETEVDIEEVKNYLHDNYNKFNIDGSTSMLPLHQSLNNLFAGNKEAEHSKTVDAFEKFISGENDILLGVDYSDELLEKAKNNGIELVKKEITREAFVFLINKNNPVKSLTVNQIKDIYSGFIKNWGELGGYYAHINAYQRNSDSGSQMQMVKFMGNTELMEEGVEYHSTMGYVVEQIGNYDQGRYSIGYNFYTFTEKQYPNDDVILLEVNGVYPDDETIFDETYPIVVYNYIYYDANNTVASEFAENLYIYLMSEEGQQLISNSGYVNLNAKLDRNKNIEPPYDYELNNREYTDIGFYNEEKGEFYDVDWQTDEVLVFKSYADYILGNTKYKNNEKARDYLTLIFDSDIPICPFTNGIWEETGIITLNPWFTATFDPEDVFNYKYDDIYYSYFKYYIEEDKFVLEAISQDLFDECAEWGYFNNFSEYANDYIPDATLEITKEDLKNLCLRTFDYDFNNNMTENGIKLNYIQPFK